MTSIQIALPDTLGHFVQEQVAKGGYASESDYVQALLRDAQVRDAKRELEEKLMAGLRTPVSPMTPADWQELRESVLQRSPELRSHEPTD